MLKNGRTKNAMNVKIPKKDASSAALLSTNARDLELVSFTEIFSPP